MCFDIPTLNCLLCAFNNFANKFLWKFLQNFFLFFSKKIKFYWNSSFQNSLPLCIEEVLSMSNFFCSIVQIIFPDWVMAELTTLNPFDPRMFRTSTGSIFSRNLSFEILKMEKNIKSMSVKYVQTQIHFTWLYLP